MRACIFGASGGIGRALADALARRHPRVTLYTGSRNPIDLEGGSGLHFGFDLQDEDSIRQAAGTIAADGALDMVFVATGVLRREGKLEPEKSWRSLDAAAMAEVFAINAIGPALIAKHFLPLLARDRKAVFAALSARVGSIGDNRLGGWHSYRASKAALNMLIRNFAIELATRNPSGIVVGLHPGTVDTNLSRPFQRGVAADRLFTPDFSAERLLDVLDALEPSQSGRLLAWDGKEIPF